MCSEHRAYAYLFEFGRVALMTFMSALPRHCSDGRRWPSLSVANAHQLQILTLSYPLSQVASQRCWTVGAMCS